MRYECIYDIYDEAEAELPRCPCCLSDCEVVYRDKNNVIVGCENCIDTVDAYEINF